MNTNGDIVCTLNLEENAIDVLLVEHNYIINLKFNKFNYVGLNKFYLNLKQNKKGIVNIDCGDVCLKKGYLQIHYNYENSAHQKGIGIYRIYSGVNNNRLIDFSDKIKILLDKMLSERGSILSNIYRQSDITDILLSAQNLSLSEYVDILNKTNKNKIEIEKQHNRLVTNI